MWDMVVRVGNAESVENLAEKRRRMKACGKLNAEG